MEVEAVQLPQQFTDFSTCLPPQLPRGKGDASSHRCSKESFSKPDFPLFFRKRFSISTLSVNDCRRRLVEAIRNVNSTTEFFFIQRVHLMLGNLHFFREIYPRTQENEKPNNYSRRTSKRSVFRTQGNNAKSSKPTRKSSESFRGRSQSLNPTHSQDPLSILFFLFFFPSFNGIIQIAEMFMSP